METGKNDTILAIIAGAAGMAVLAVTVSLCFYGACSVWRRGGAGSQDRGPA